jgi:hypothetical protein
MTTPARTRCPPDWADAACVHNQAWSKADAAATRVLSGNGGATPAAIRIELAHVAAAAALAGCAGCPLLGACGSWVRSEPLYDGVAAAALYRHGHPIGRPTGDDLDRALEHAAAGWLAARHRAYESGDIARLTIHAEHEHRRRQTDQQKGTTAA